MLTTIVVGEAVESTSEAFGAQMHFIVDDDVGRPVTVGGARIKPKSGQGVLGEAGKGDTTLVGGEDGGTGACVKIDCILKVVGLKLDGVFSVGCWGTTCGGIGFGAGRRVNAFSVGSDVAFFPRARS